MSLRGGGPGGLFSFAALLSFGPGGLLSRLLSALCVLRGQEAERVAAFPQTCRRPDGYRTWQGLREEPHFRVSGGPQAAQLKKKARRTADGGRRAAFGSFRLPPAGFAPRSWPWCDPSRRWRSTWAPGGGPAWSSWSLQRREDSKGRLRDHLGITGRAAWPLAEGIMDLINSYCHSVYLSVLMNPANQRGWPPAQPRAPAQGSAVSSSAGSLLRLPQLLFSSVRGRTLSPGTSWTSFTVGITEPYTFFRSLSSPFRRAGCRKEGQ